MRRIPVIIGLCLLLSPLRAGAEPIGTFAWTYDALFGTGSTFSVGNESTLTFFDVNIDLFGPDDTIAFHTLSLGNIAAGASAQSIDDLSWLLVPELLSRALVRLVFNDLLITASIAAPALEGDPIFLLQGSASLDTDSATVSEPSTFLLANLAIAFVMWRLHRRAYVR